MRKFCSGEIEAMDFEDEEEKKSELIDSSKVSVLDKYYLPNGVNVFEESLTKSCIHSIFDFLDPTSLTRMKRVCK